MKRLHVWVKTTLQWSVLLPLILNQVELGILESFPEQTRVQEVSPMKRRGSGNRPNLLMAGAPSVSGEGVGIDAKQYTNYSSSFLNFCLTLSSNLDDFREAADR